jgi:hypothetical protein
MPSKQRNYIILTHKDGLHVWQEPEDEQWDCHVVRDDVIVTAEMGPFESKALALQWALNEYLGSNQ